MTDWNTIDLDAILTNGHNSNSRKSSSQSSGRSENKENTADRQADSRTAADKTGARKLVLAKGGELLDESKTELSPTEAHSQKKLFLESDSSHGAHNGGSGCVNGRSTSLATAVDSNPAEAVVIPIDANLSTFTNDQLASFLRCLKVEDRIVSHLHHKQVDGKRFSRLKDSELDSLGIKNPVVVFFRDKSKLKSKGKGKGPFLL